jgi:membrane fusion protein (multidrug efflux system)
MTATRTDRNESQAGSPPHGPTAAKFVSLLGVVVVVIVVALWAGLAPRWRQQSALAAQTGELAIPTVAVVSPAPAKAPPGLLLPAEVKPWIATPIYARASGYLKRWLVDIGTHVEAGQLLAEIETPELDQELERSRYELAQAQAAAALAKILAERSAKLAQSQSIPGEETDQKQTDLALKTATAEAAAANVRRLEKLQAFARITAPFAGTITARETDIGDLIAAGGAKELFRLAQTNRLRVYVRVPQTYARAIIPGRTADLLVPELAKKVFPAKVASTAGAISADSRTLLTELDVENTGGEILAGSYVQVRFSQAQGEAALTVPGNALLFRAEGPQVGVVRQDDTVELRSVTLGRDFGQEVEILAGLSPQDRVILNPSDSLVDGTTVRIAAPPTPEKAK